MKGIFHRLIGGLGLVATIFAVVQPVHADDIPKKFEIRAADLATALEKFGRQSGKGILFNRGQTAGAKATAVVGEYEPQAALQMVLAGTGLTFRSVNTDTYVVEVRAPLEGDRGEAMAPAATPHPNKGLGPAQAAEPYGLEQILVTARKRVESLQDVPVAVSAISRTALQNNSANTLEKIGELVPQVSIGRVTSGTGAVLTIRGISSAGVDSGLDQSVLLSIDGVSLSRGRIAQSAMFDLQQVEVMQGPQALFFGKNSPAGVISMSSADPTDLFEGYVVGGYEFKARQRYAETALSGSINDAWKARLALRYDAMDGWIKNNAPAQTNPFQPFAPLPGAAQGQGTSPRGHNLSGRVTVLWEPAPDFSAKLKVTINRERLNGNAGNNDNYCTNGLTVPDAFGVPESHTDCLVNMVRTVSNLPPVLAVNYPYANGGVPYLRSDLALASLTLAKTFDRLTLVATTGYYDQSHKGSNLGDFSEFAQIYLVEAERYRLFNQELRANTTLDGPVNVMAGVYYEHSNRRFFNSPSIFNIYNPVAGNYTSFIARSNSLANSYSAFGQVRWKIVPPVELAIGLRYTHDSKTSSLRNEFSNPALTSLGIFLLPDNVPLRAQYTGNNVSPEITLAWKPTPDQMLYAAYKTGYKAGGISSSPLLASSATDSNIVFGPEKVEGFEVGYKAAFLHNTVRFDVTAYRYNYNGLQVTGLETVTYRYSIRNAARARTTGVQGSLEWLATDRLTLTGNIGYNRARYISFPNAQCWTGQTAVTGCVAGAQDLTGKALNRAPNVAFRLGADYKAAPWKGWIADLSLSASYSSSFETSADYSPGGPQPAYWLLNTAIHLAPESERYRLSLIGRNLTNTFYKISSLTRGLGSPYQFLGFFNRPREILLQAEYTF